MFYETSIKYVDTFGKLHAIWINDCCEYSDSYGKIFCSVDELQKYNLLEPEGDDRKTRNELRIRHLMETGRWGIASEIPPNFGGIWDENRERIKGKPWENNKVYLNYFGRPSFASRVVIK